MSDFIQKTKKFIVDVYVLYAVAFYEFFWAFVYVFKKRSFKDIENENILVTGAGSGIGKNLALKLAAMNNTIICVDINEAANDETVKEIQEQNGKAFGFACDVADSDKVQQLFLETRSKVGKVSYLYNVAGVVSGKRFLNLTPSDVKSSVAGLFGSPKLVDYCSSKFAVQGFMEALKLEAKMLKLPIHFTTICPFFIRTGMFDGVHSKWPFFMPILETDYVCNKIVEATQNNRVIVVLPKIFYYIMLVKAVVPDRLAFHVNMFMGTFEVMDHFRGRQRIISDDEKHR